MEIPEEILKSPRVVRITAAMRRKLIILRVLLLPFVGLGIAALAVMMMVLLWALCGVDRPVTLTGYLTVPPGATQAAATMPPTTQIAATERSFGAPPLEYTHRLMSGESPWEQVAIVWITGSLFVVIAVPAWIHSISIPRRRRKLYASGEAVIGEIIRKYQGMNGKLIAHSLYYEFTTESGQKQQGIMIMSRPEWDTAEVGPAVVMYNIDHPGRNVLYGFGGYKCT